MENSNFRLASLPPANLVCEGYVFTRICHSVHGGCLPQCMLGYHPSRSRHPPGADTTPPPHPFAVHAGRYGQQASSLRRLCFYTCLSFCPWGACMVGGCAWLLRGACVVAPGGACMVAPWGVHAWLLPGGACVVAPGGHAWLLPGGACMVAPGGHAWDTTRYGDTINERAVCILLECILVVTARAY